MQGKILYRSSAKQPAGFSWMQGKILYRSSANHPAGCSAKFYIGAVQIIQRNTAIQSPYKRQSATQIDQQYEKNLYRSSAKRLAGFSRMQCKILYRSSVMLPVLEFLCYVVYHIYLSLKTQEIKLWENSLYAY